MKTSPHSVAAGLPVRRPDHPGDPAAGTVADPHFLGRLLLPLRLPGDLDRAVRPGTRRRVLLCGGRLEGAAVHQAGTAERRQQPSGGAGAGRDPDAGRQSQVWNWRLVYFTTALPFFVAGTIVSLAISETIERVDRVYFFDLLGAAGGCLLLLPLLELARRPEHGDRRRRSSSPSPPRSGTAWPGSVAGRAGSVALALALVAFLIYNHRHPVIDIRHAKDQTLANEIFVKWNSFSRIAVVPTKTTGTTTIVIDADAATAIVRLRFRPPDARRAARPARAGPGAALRRPARRQDPDHRTRRRMGCSARPRLRQPRHHRRRDQPDHRRPPIMRERFPQLSNGISTCGPTSTSTSKTAAASSAAAPTNTRCSRRRWSIPGPPPRPAPSRSRKTISTPPTPSAITSRTSPTTAWWPSPAGASIRRANRCG